MERTSAARAVGGNSARKGRFMEYSVDIIRCYVYFILCLYSFLHV